MTTRILTVCTGNICRSPYAERLLAAALHRLGLTDDDARVASAGTNAHEGAAMTPEMAVRTTQHGADPRDHVARQLTPDEIREADLVLALTRDHRRATVELVPAAAPRAYTLTEFARLADDALTAGLLDGIAAGGALDAFLDTVWSRRGVAPPPDDPADDDVVDPYLQPAEVHDEAAAHIADAVTRIEAALAHALQEVHA